MVEMDNNMPVVQPKKLEGQGGKKSEALIISRMSYTKEFMVHF